MLAKQNNSKLWWRGPLLVVVIPVALLSICNNNNSDSNYLTCDSMVNHLKATIALDDTTNNIDLSILNNDSLVNINLNDSLSLYFNCSSNSLVKDSVYISVSRNLMKNIQLWINMVGDTSLTSAITCDGSNSRLRKGDISYIMINENTNITLNQLIGSQLDSYSSFTCHYPIGFFDVLDKNRNSIINNLRLFFKVSRASN
jgi:hypothetical protein